MESGAAPYVAGYSRELAIPMFSGRGFGMAEALSVSILLVAECATAHQHVLLGAVHSEAYECRRVLRMKSQRRLPTWCKGPTCHWERLKAIEGGSRGIKRLDGITDPVDMNVSKLWEIMKDKAAWGVAVRVVAESRTQFSDCTTTA